MTWLPGEAPASFMDQDMMMATDQDQVVEAGVATFGPMGEMVDIAPMRGSVTAGKHTSQVPSTDRYP
jgi:hypothetical protein